MNLVKCSEYDVLESNLEHILATCILGEELALKKYLECCPDK